MNVRDLSAINERKWINGTKELVKKADDVVAVTISVNKNFRIEGIAVQLVHEYATHTLFEWIAALSEILTISNLSL